jgi:hypothetical protein
MQVEDKSLEEAEEVMGEEEVLNYLTAVGVNSCHRQYDEKAKSMYQAYLGLPLSTLVNAWTHLNDQVKITILNMHLDDFKRWIEESSND